MAWLKNLWTDNWFTRKLAKMRKEKKYKAKLAEIKKRDPFIYK